MSRYSLKEFVEAHSQQNKGEGVFELERHNLLEVNLDGLVWTKMGSMVAYQGRIKFTREGALEHGVGRLMKELVTGEGMMLTKAEGRGRLYLADLGKKVTVLKLENESLFVNGNDVLAFESTLQWNITLMRKVTGMLSGGLFNVRFEGTGMVAITTHYDPLVLPVRVASVCTDPNATVAWSGGLIPELKTDITFKTLLGRGSGESIQMEFSGTGFVVVQPYEEAYMQRRG